MSLDTVLLARRRIFAADLESTTGTPATLGAAQAAFAVYDLKPVGDIPYIARQRQGGFGTETGIPGAPKGTVTFFTYLTGAGTGSGSHTKLLKGCGLTASGSIYTADATANQSLTIGGFYDGRRFQLAGAMGDVEFTIKNGEPVRADWTFSGVWIAPDSQALPTPTYPTVLPPRAISSAITIGGVQYTFDEIKVRLGNDVILREDTASNGYRSAWITDRHSKVTVAPEALALATQDWFAAYLAGNEYALSAAVGSTGNKFTIASSHLQQSKNPDIGDRNRIMTDGLEFDINQDDLTITFA